jgi:hypothetical protein
MPTTRALTNGQFTKASAKWARGVANSVEANERRRHEPPLIDWNKAIANVIEILDDNCEPDI